MNEIRLNKEEEKEVVKARFKIPPLIIGLLVLILVHAIVLFIVGILLEESTSLSLGIVALIIVLPMVIIWIIAIKKSFCIVTNKRIYGVTSVFIIRKKYSYRLDEVDNIETVSTLGIHGLALSFSQGHGPQGDVKYSRGTTILNGAGTFKISFIANIDEVYAKLSDLLTSVKNDRDLMVDIEMSKIDAENRKAAAFEKMASNINSDTSSKINNKQNYVEELKGLKELLDAGIISEEEFNDKKRNILNP